MAGIEVGQGVDLYSLSSRVTRRVRTHAVYANIAFVTFLLTQVWAGMLESLQWSDCNGTITPE